MFKRLRPRRDQGEGSVLEVRDRAAPRSQRRSSPENQQTNGFVRMDEMWWPRGEDDGSLLSQMTKDAAEAGAAVRHYHNRPTALSEWMKCGGRKRRGEGSLLSQMTKDAAEAGAAVRHYHNRPTALSEWMKCGGRKRRGEGSLLSQMTKDAAEAGAAVRHYHKAERMSISQ